MNTAGAASGGNCRIPPSGFPCFLFTVVSLLIVCFLYTFKTLRVPINGGEETHLLDSDLV